MTNPRVGFSSPPACVHHDTGPHHPERPDRLRAIHRALRQSHLLISPDPFPDFKLDLPLNALGACSVGSPPLLELPVTPADPSLLSLVHTPDHIVHVQRICKSGGGVLDQGDTPVGKNSYDIALLSLGATLACCDAVMTSQVTRAFAAARPPGHHAEPNRPMGFCLFNNIALAARYLQTKYALNKIAIVDVDVHHGNGTQAAFYADPSVLFISLHQHPRTCYPGTGHADETGEGPGQGTTLNLPLQPGSDDPAYHHLFDQQVLPTLDAFRPEILLISAGFDAHAQDPLANINLTDDSYHWMTRDLVQIANQHCQGKLISTLEGGYHLHALARSVVRHLDALRA